MRELLKRIFDAYEFEQKWADKNIEFYSSINEKKTNFYLINYIDATNQNWDSVILNKQVNQLEKEYANEDLKDSNLREKLESVIEDKSLAARIDKNISTIYPIKFSSLENLDAFQNMIFAIEESPYYFRRYVLPYTEEQIKDINKYIEELPDSDISSLLSAYANDLNKYNSFSKHNNVNDAYYLIIRLFAKIPFFQFNFSTSDKPKSAKEQIEEKVPQELSSIHNLIKSNTANVDRYIKARNYQIEANEIADEFRNRIAQE